VTLRTDGIRIRHGGAEDVPALRSLWLEIQHTHRASAPTVGRYLPDEESWQLRSAEYVEWLATPDAFLLLAEDPDARIVGYALTHFLPGPDDSWETDSRIADMESLCVAPELRGSGLGSRLLEEVEGELARLGLHDMYIGVVAGNDDAQRFYEMRGYHPTMVFLSNFRQPEDQGR
jgi:GNAT superfamily N-acetyltransferase